MPPSTATQVRPGSRFTLPTRYSVTPAGPTRLRPGSSHSSGSGSPASTNAVRAVVAALVASAAASGHVVVGVVPDPEAAAEVRDARDPAELVAAARGERREPHDRLGLRVEVRELRADVDVNAEHVEPTLERVGDERARLVGRQPELRAVVPGADRLVGVGVDAERDAHEHALDAGAGCQLGLVRARRARRAPPPAPPGGGTRCPCCSRGRRARHPSGRRRARTRARPPRRRPRRCPPRAAGGAGRRSGTPSRRRRRDRRPRAARSARARARIVSSQRTTSGVPYSAARSDAVEPAEREHACVDARRSPGRRSGTGRSCLLQWKPCSSFSRSPGRKRGESRADSP